jgi:predicted DNA-binding protein
MSPKNEPKKTSRLSYRIPDSLNDQLFEVARRLGRRRSDIVREALTEYLKKLEKAERAGID